MSNTSFSLACSNQKTCMILSAFSTVSIEDVASAGGEGLRWFHLAITMPDDLVKEHIARAEKSGYKALVIYRLTNQMSKFVDVTSISFTRIGSIVWQTSPSPKPQQM